MPGVRKTGVIVKYIDEFFVVFLSSYAMSCDKWKCLREFLSTIEVYCLLQAHMRCFELYYSRRVALMLTIQEGLCCL